VRTLLVIAGTVVATLLLAWAILRPTAELRTAPGVKAEVAPRRAAGDSDHLAALSLQHGAAVAEQLAALEARLKGVEAAHARGDAAKARSEEPSDSTVESGKPKRLSEGDLAAWMRSELGAAGYDPSRTREAEQQIEQSLSALPGVELDDAECGARFCRCTLSRADGERPEVDELFGAPPFVNQAFTIFEADGSVSIFFTSRGVSIDQLRLEAKAARGT
jgi:hypothetical protein